MKNTIFAFLLAVIFSISANAQMISADLVIINANVRTMDDKMPKAQSIAVLGNKIIAVGSDSDTKSLIGKTTRVVDAKGKLVIPGFNDSHIHFMDGGAGLSSVDLRDAKTPEEFVSANQEFCREIAERSLDFERKLGSRKLDSGELADEGND